MDGHRQQPFRAELQPFRGAGRCSPVRPKTLGVQSCLSSGPPGPTGPLGPLEGEAPEPVAEGGEVLVPEVSEGRAAKPLRAPALPNPEEIEAHYVSHIPYRAWCSHCVRGRGKSFAHHRVDRPEDPEEVPVVSIDYGFFGAPGELPSDAVGGAQMPVLVVRDRKSKALFSHLVPSKGVEHFYPEHALARDIRFLGYPSVVLKSDQERSIRAVAEAVKNSFAAREGVRVQLENSPKGDDRGKSNGEAEAAVEITQGLCRTYKDACEKGLGERIDPKSPLLGWLVEHAGSMYTLFSHDETMKDGLTPFRRLKGRDWAVALPAWGETVDYRVRTKHKLEPRWQAGIYCGVRLGTTEKIIATEDGVVVVQSIRRKPKELRWDADLFKKAKGTPWAPQPKKAARPDEALELPAAVAIEPELPDEPATDVEAGPKPELLKRVYLRQQDLDRHGYTASCPACDLIRVGISREGVNHTEFCRSRVVGEMAKTDEGKKRLAAAKLKETPRSKLRVAEAPSEPSPPTAPVAKRSTEEASTQEAQVSKKPKAEEAKRARLDAGGSSAGPAQGPASEGPSAMEVSGPEPASSSKRPHPGGDEGDMVLDFLLSLRTGFLASVAGDPYPVCEEKFDTDIYEKFETSYWDDVSGKPLRPELVQEARKEEVSTINEMGVWEVIPRPKGEKVITTRWVDVNKKDEANPKYRSRLVARELKKRYPGGISQEAHQPTWEDFYASMPPISALRVLFALATTKKAPDLEGKMRDLPKDQCLVFLDIKKAHFWADARRRLLIELPAETGVDTSKYVGLLRKSLYGTRDAPANWEATILRVMTRLGFVRGR